MTKISYQLYTTKGGIMELGLTGKVAVITGAGSQIGFGKTIALTLAREGCNVAIVDIDLEGSRQTSREIEISGRETIAIKTDVSSAGEVNNMVKAILEHFKHIDILINNAGACTPPKPFLEMNEAECDRDININLKGVINCTRAVLPHMLERKYGKIVNISSGAAIEGAAVTSVYAAAKGGVISFTRSIAKGVAASGINVNCIAPGLANTGFARQAPPGMLENYRKNIPLGRITEPQDIANTVVFLVSDVSSDIVGQTISVDGGVILL
jgi:NAD(P)-dependent dehydrogenase (short-subunit alcohol dehydrogenase family)